MHGKQNILADSKMPYNTAIQMHPQNVQYDVFEWFIYNINGIKWHKEQEKINQALTASSRERRITVNWPMWKGQKAAE